MNGPVILALLLVVLCACGFIAYDTVHVERDRPTLPTDEYLVALCIAVAVIACVVVGAIAATS